MNKQKWQVRSPVNQEILDEVDLTDLGELPGLFLKAKQTQEKWALVKVSERARLLVDLKEVIIQHMDEISDLICKENGKPRTEAMVHDIITSLESIHYFAKSGVKTLKDQRIHLGSPLFLLRKSYLIHRPLGVISVISPWNFPLFFPITEICMAVLAGNAVIFKPSEYAMLIGRKIQSLFEEAGFPRHLVETVYGDGKLGAAIIDQRPAKIFFTGSVATGKKIMGQASQYLIPVNLELGGKDPMIVLPDANVDFATSAALWGAFANSGQICASTQRILIPEAMKDAFIKSFKEKAEKLRHIPNDSAKTDLGAITMPKQKEVYDRQLADAKSRSLEVVTGGEWQKDRVSLEPTVFMGNHIEESDVYLNETFGPIKTITTYQSVSEAIEKANNTKYGLLASVITSNPALGLRVAKQIEAGTVIVNEVAFTAGAPETPWGGVKESGFGTKHSDKGLLEFVHSQHINMPKRSLYTFKSLWWFPYSPFQYETFRTYAKLHRSSWFSKLASIPWLLWNFTHLIKSEKRL
ncbi:MAG: aldehyde dehydrogenase family protein [Xanthomonadaceae bacterium]|nr:aldehyde dehydrogenase family protein [Xanthomonadaceae bacterium]